MRRTPLNRRRTRGFSFVELILAVGILSIGILGTLSCITFSGRLAQMERETATAMECCEATLATLRSTTFDDLYDDFGPGAAEIVDVPGEATLNNSVISTTFYINETANMPELGLPRDLNGDEDSTDADVSDDYLLLPVTVRIDWTGPMGARFYELHSLLANR